MSSDARPVIVLSRELPEAFSGALQSFAEIRVNRSPVNMAVFEGASVYLATGVDPVPATLIERMPSSVGLIANIATGTDNIDIEAARVRGMAVSNTPPISDNSVVLPLRILPTWRSP